MKQSLTILFLLLTLAGYSQQLTYGSGGRVYNSENKKLRTDEVRALLADNAEALSLYNAGRNKKTWGNVLFSGGLGLVAINLVIAMNSDNITSESGTIYSNNGYGNPIVSYTSAHSERANMTAAIIGGALIIASIPIKIGYPRKIKSSLEKYNKGLAETYKPQPKTTLLASANQIGFKIEF
ncbi:hypothetical protein SAMN05444397_105260 [Flavobacterium aquidurense]|uniref:Uncharacterized protein n=1 Tax=Flavobacterium frigidimaris TaxID=262320 RepID=A0ABX4BWD3_FLAFR|nr:hypothetical protein [Flavobacterium frigidimaris]OXA81897.1 hypothetical protein B0A65_02365 [Flavobacterium frigidimaris]SDZ33784.1 hypothetical protein SAMN05444397_105260 [Flavobacterium aquidurense]